MENKNGFAIFFDDIKKDAQKRLISAELQKNFYCDEDESKVERITINEGLLGYNEEHPEKSDIFQVMYAETKSGCWFMIWDAFRHKFDAVTKA